MVVTDLRACDPIYQCIVADPPWPYKDKLPGKGRGAAKYYTLMSIEEISSLYIPSAENCHCWLWTASGFVELGYSVLRSWGFEPKQQLVWVKTGKHGGLYGKMGMGRHMRIDTESCLFGVKGKLPPLNRNVRNTLFCPRQEHSRKPEKFFSKKVENISPGPYLEMFARTTRENWDCWGTETERFEPMETPFR